MKWIPIAALAVTLFAVSLVAPTAPILADEPKSDENLFDNDTFGVKIWKPKGKDQWKFTGFGGFKEFFEDNELNGVFILRKWQSDNLQGNPQKSPPLVTMYGTHQGTMDKVKVGDWEGTPGQSKGYLKAISELLLSRDYKDPKNVTDVKDAAYPFGKAQQWSCYATHRKYGGAFYVRVIAVKFDAKHSYTFWIQCPPGEEKPEKSGKEIEEVLRSIKLYELKK